MKCVFVLCSGYIEDIVEYNNDEQDTPSKQVAPFTISNEVKQAIRHLCDHNPQPPAPAGLLPVRPHLLQVIASCATSMPPCTLLTCAVVQVVAALHVPLERHLESFLQSDMFREVSEAFVNGTRSLDTINI